eukprot:TRINITY_DN6672_c0_g1_i2.p1 TRINITY_DN6672_c0_g1~~TRINITY_DN6672_c0_g1_i2.p1  ORF type:complete len:1202 (-),score=323.56 TRINITY_DN6672_c0_g1_i2:71-3676(-)
MVDSPTRSYELTDEDLASEVSSLPSAEGEDAEDDAANDASLLIDNDAAIELNRHRDEKQTLTSESGDARHFTNIVGKVGMNARPSMSSENILNDVPTLAQTIKKAGSDTFEKTKSGRGEEDLILDFLRLGSSAGEDRFRMNDRHRALSRVVRQIFAQQEDFPDKSEIHPVDRLRAAAPSADGLTTFRWAWRSFQVFCAKALHNMVFKIFFLILTFYMLVVPDAVIIYGDSRHDQAFQTLNTVVFLLFFMELVFFIAGQPKFLCSLNFWLDLVALFSILTDTLLMSSFDILDEDGARVSRMARSSRMTRLARIARVARITRLIPTLLGVCRKQRRELGKILLARRLWRMFVFLSHRGPDKRMTSISGGEAPRPRTSTVSTDSDHSMGLLCTTFDFKCLYLTFLQDCTFMLKKTKLQILQNDLKYMGMQKCFQGKQQDLSFPEFARAMFGTSLGEELMKFHEEAVEDEHGVYQLTQKLRDNTALKVCIGIMVLIGCMSVLQSSEQDGSVQQSLAQLDLIATAEHQLVERTPDALCEQVSVFAQRHKALFIVLDGLSYWYSGRCQEGAAVSMFSKVAEIVSASTMRHSDYVTAYCNAAECKHLNVASLAKAGEGLVAKAAAAVGSGGARSLVLVNNMEEAKGDAKQALVQTCILLLLLLVFVYILNMGIATFSKTMLKPLRAISDDVTALACTDLVQLDCDMPPSAEEVAGGAAGRGTIQVPEELLHLQSAFKGMQSAIRSWTKYVPPVVVERLFQAGVEATIGVAKVNASVFFCDIDNFEAICVGREPHEVLDLLSTVLEEISAVIARYKGTLLEFIGDEVLAVYNIPNAVRNHTAAAAISAVEVHKAIAALPPIDMPDGTQARIRCRCGVHTANLLAGNLGSVQRIKYGVLGDGVNLTARMKSLTSRYDAGTLCSELVAQDEICRKRLICRPVDLVAVKGKTKPTTVYEIIGAAKAYGNAKKTYSDAAIGDEWMRQAATLHSEGFKFYLNRDFVAAEMKFAAVKELFLQASEIDDKPADMLIARCKRYAKAPPPPEWDGVERLQKKSFADAPPPPEEPTPTPVVQDNAHAVPNGMTAMAPTSPLNLELVHMSEENGRDNEIAAMKPTTTSAVQSIVPDPHESVSLVRLGTHELNDVKDPNALCGPHGGCSLSGPRAPFCYACCQDGTSLALGPDEDGAPPVPCVDSKVVPLTLEDVAPIGQV